MSGILGYDKTNPLSIEKYAQRLIGKTFGEVCDADRNFVYEEVQEASNYAASHGDKKYKGGLGNLIEERYFHYKANSDSDPDFKEAGVELKVTPYKINPNGSYSAKERLVITMIDYFKVIEESFEDSHLWNKARLMLIIYYLYDKRIQNRLFYQIHFAKLFTPPENDKRIIMHDFYVIKGKIEAGLAHELSEGDTLYLGAAIKAASSKDRREQPNSDILAKPRAFSFKNSYMTYVLNNYIVPGLNTYESIVGNEQTDDFEAYVKGKLDVYAGKSVGDLCKEFAIDISTSKPKHLEAILTYRMLGIKGNKAEEFEKANIVIKTIRIGKNGKIKENMSFPNFKFTELVNEEWDDSVFGNYLRNTRFFFVVFKFNQNDELVLKGGQFWNIEYKTLETDVKQVWERTKEAIQNGLQITEHNGKRTNNLPKQSENPVCHVRPHGKDSKDTYPLPDGREYTKQCFWLNNSFIYAQLDSQLKK